MKWLVGCVAFFLPAAIAALGKRMDQSAFRNDPTYAAFIPVVCWTSLLLAIAVPSVLVMRAKMTLLLRSSFLFLIGCLLLLELFWVFLSLVHTRC